MVNSQRRLNCRSFLASLLLCFATLSHALSMDEARLLRKEYQQYQAWVLGRDYLFGTTMPVDKIRALAWQLVYLGFLPTTYPQKERLLSPYKGNLTKEQLAYASELAQVMREHYNLLEPFSESELYALYALHEANASWNTLDLPLPPKGIWANFSDYLDWVRAQNQPEVAVELAELKQKLMKARQYPIVYGQVFVLGPESLEMIHSDVKILPGGFFIGQVSSKDLVFSMPGYNRVFLAIDKNRSLQAIPPVILSKRPTSKKTGVVGRVLPWAGVERANMVLRSVESADNKAPWYYPAVPLTITNDGQFYATDLSPGRYELYISTAGLKTSKQFTVKTGEIRGLSLIDLRKLAAKP